MRTNTYNITVINSKYYYSLIQSADIKFKTAVETRKKNLVVKYYRRIIFRSFLWQLFFRIILTIQGWFLILKLNI